MDSLQTNQYEEDSFLILGSTSPKTSLEMAMVESKILQNSRGSEDLKQPTTLHNLNDGPSLPGDIMSFKAHFSFDEPSPTSLQRAGAVMRECADSEEMRARVAELLEENLALRETLKQNNVSMREQFRTILTWQEDMLHTHQMHKAKFQETKALVEKLRSDNSKLITELQVLRDEKLIIFNSEESRASSGSGIHLEEMALLENQRRQVLADNEQLSARVRDLEGQVRRLQDYEANNMKLQAQIEVLMVEKQSLGTIETGASNCSLTEADFVITAQDKLSRSDLETTIDMLTSQLEVIERQRRQVIGENEQIMQQASELRRLLKEMEQDDTKIKQAENISNLETKVCSLQVELTKCQEDLLQAENIKLELSQHRLQAKEAAERATAALADLGKRLREAHTVAFQPVRYSLSLEAQCDSSEFSNFVENVRLYDATLKDLAGYLNQHAQQFCMLFQTIAHLLMEIGSKTHDPSQTKFKLLEIKESLDKYNNMIANYNHQVKSALGAFEKMFLDYQQVLRLLKDHENVAPQYEQLRKEFDGRTAQLVHKEEQVVALQKETADLKEAARSLQAEVDERDILRMQLDIYKKDFEAERASRTQMASEKDEIQINMNVLHRRNQDLTEEVNNYRTRYGNTGVPLRPSQLVVTSAPSTSGVQSAVNTLNHDEYSCPNCLYKTPDYGLMDTHIMECLNIGPPYD